MADVEKSFAVVPDRGSALGSTLTERSNVLLDSTWDVGRHVHCFPRDRFSTYAQSHLQAIIRAISPAGISTEVTFLESNGRAGRIAAVLA